MTPATVSEANLETMAAAGTKKIAAAGIPVITTGRIMARITLCIPWLPEWLQMLRKRFPTTAVLGKASENIIAKKNLI